ncbi:acyl CoA binding protein-domain-containing protein [Cyathus striatus]|nr:acyl CoA binding protein-domain-containing protein [Cyathus striatus]
MSKAKFDKADGPVKPSQEDQLYFYKYFKQANTGDNNTTRPGLLDFTGKAKWDAWTSVKGTSTEEAYTKYVEKLLEILKSAGDEQSKKYVEEIEAA